jgi:hypothetical protein
LTAENESDRRAPDADPWIIDGMLPIAVAHAEAAAKAAGMTIGEWLSRILVEQTSAPDDTIADPVIGNGPTP